MKNLFIFFSLVWGLNSLLFAQSESKIRNGVDKIKSEVDYFIEKKTPGRSERMFNELMNQLQRRAASSRKEKKHASKENESCLVRVERLKEKLTEVQKGKSPQEKSGKDLLRERQGDVPLRLMAEEWIDAPIGSYNELLLRLIQIYLDQSELREGIQVFLSFLGRDPSFTLDEEYLDKTLQAQKLFGKIGSGFIVLLMMRSGASFIKAYRAGHEAFEMATVKAFKPYQFFSKNPKAQLALFAGAASAYDIVRFTKVNFFERRLNPDDMLAVAQTEALFRLNEQAAFLAAKRKNGRAGQCFQFGASLERPRPSFYLPEDEKGEQNINADLEKMESILLEAKTLREGAPHLMLVAPRLSKEELSKMLEKHHAQRFLVGIRLFLPEPTVWKNASFYSLFEDLGTILEKIQGEDA
jgi:hypothetical protein